MRKLIAVVAIVLGAGFALQLAMAEGETNSTSQQPGVADSTTTTESTTTTTKESQSQSRSQDNVGANTKGNAGDVVAKEEKYKSARSCTDDNGVTFRKGQPGFDHCIQGMKQKDVGGQAASESTATSRPSEESGTSNGSTSGG